MSFLLVKKHSIAREINGNDLEGQRIQIYVPCLRLSTETISLEG